MQYNLYICKICKEEKPHLSVLDSNIKKLNWCNDCQKNTEGKWIILTDDENIYSKPNNKKIDNELSHIIKVLNKKGIKTLGSCCGHGKYKPTIVYKHNNKNIELFTGIIIPRKTRFYLKDKEGYYYIPECITK